MEVAWADLERELHSTKPASIRSKACAEARQKSLLAAKSIARAISETIERHSPAITSRTLLEKIQSNTRTDLQITSNYIRECTLSKSNVRVARMDTTAFVDML